MFHPTQPSTAVVVFQIYYQNYICMSSPAINWPCDGSYRTTWCAPKEHPDPKTSPKVLQMNELMHSLNETLARILKRGFKIVLMHPLPEPGASNIQEMTSEHVHGA
jgi:hypothetical protein